MQEAWAYYNGKQGMSGKNYSPSILATGCQKNFVLYIGNAFNVSGSPADGGSESPDNATNGLRSTQVGATPAQLSKITGIPPGSTSVTFRKPDGSADPTCGVPSLASSSSGSNWSENWADEWARLMKEQDGSADGQGQQNIVTYTIGVVNDSACKPDYPALLSTMAKYGGGSYYKTSNTDEIKNAIDSILNEIQAVNSVFASATLPVSVNAQGTFLNQIFLGIFRPDKSANPRWLGNLKQYQLAKIDGELVLADKNGDRAIQQTGNRTGFIDFQATSFWTQRTASAPDSTGGFFKNIADGSIARGATVDASNPSPNPFDLPDGNLVEKGGAAQQLRLENLTVNFAASAATPSNPRRLYTYCPVGSLCNSTLTGSTALSHSKNAFAIENLQIPATAFGDSTTAKINSITRSGSTAEVVTASNHGFTLGTTSVTISNVTNPTSYNGTYTANACTANIPTCFKITGLGDYPNATSANAYTFATIGAGSVNVTTMTRTTNGTNASASGLNKETVTVTTGGHGFAGGSTITISGATPSDYNGNHVITVPGTGACPTLTCFTYEITITPTSPAVNTYTAVVAATGASRNISSIADTGTGGIATVTTTTAHSFHVGQRVRFAGTSNTRYDFTSTATNFTVASVGSSTSFTFTGYSANPANVGTVGTVAPSTTGIAITPSRSAGTNTVTITATGATAGAFGNAINATKVLDIVKATGTSTNEAVYAGNGVTITCTVANCSSFTYGPVATSPSSTITTSSTITATPVSGGSVTIAAGGITRSGSTATVTGATANLFGIAVNATNTVTVAVSSGTNSNESAYLGNGTWTITCTVANCSTFTFGPVTLTPTTPAVGTNMQAFAAGTSPDKNTLIKWVRGEDNNGDELGPGGTVTVRPSIHGDVLHSRPVVINYGDARGLVVFYGGNDGVFRAVNGAQTAAIGSVPAGGELWGLILPDHFGALNRQRTNSPELRLRDTQLGSARSKDYFVDGPTGSLQKLNADGTIAEALIYLTMRRGGRFIVALDVTVPTNPIFKWQINYSDTLGDGVTQLFSELGQTWSRPRVMLVAGYANPVLVFGGGYAPSEDTEPPTANTIGRGVFVVDAATGVLVWRATYGVAAGCSGSTTQATCTVPTMTHAVPSDMSFLDRSGDGKTDRMYFGDMGGNVWRVDFGSSNGATTGTTPDFWRVSKIAALGCSTGTCASGITPRKFFFAPTVITSGEAGAAGSFESILIGSGDREHPLISTAAQSSHMVTNRFYMVMDGLTSVNPTNAQLAALVPRTENGADTTSRLFPAFKSAAITGFSWLLGVMTVTTAAAHGFTTGQPVVIDGASPVTLDGRYTILDAGAAGATSFTYALNTQPSGTYAAQGLATVAVPFATSNTAPGFFTYLAVGEKVVNAPTTISGTTFFGTNRPFPVASASCASNLGEARGYALDPFSGATSSVIYDGGGLPPTAVAGVVVINGVRTSFCIGCGGGSVSATSETVDKSIVTNCTGLSADACTASGADEPNLAVPKKPARTYWYRK